MSWTLLGMFAAAFIFWGSLSKFIQWGLDWIEAMFTTKFGRK